MGMRVVHWEKYRSVVDRTEPVRSWSLRERAPLPEGKRRSLVTADRGVKWSDHQRFSTRKKDVAYVLAFDISMKFSQWPHTNGSASTPKTKLREWKIIANRRGGQWLGQSEGPNFLLATEQAG